MFLRPVGLPESVPNEATPEMLTDLMQCAQDDARLLIDRDGGLEGARGDAARIALYLFDRDAGVALLRSG